MLLLQILYLLLRQMHTIFSGILVLFHQRFLQSFDNVFRIALPTVFFELLLYESFHHSAIVLHSICLRGDGFRPFGNRRSTIGKINISDFFIKPLFNLSSKLFVPVLLSIHLLFISFFLLEHNERFVEQLIDMEFLLAQIRVTLPRLLIFKLNIDL